MKNLPKFLIPILLVVLVATVGAFYLFQKKSTPVSTGSFEWKIVRNTQSVSPPDYELEVYLTGDKISQVQAAELDAELDAELEGTNLKLTNAEAGGFYTNPLTIKMDTSEMIFAIARNPGNQTQVDPTKPLFRLRLRAQSGFSEAVFRILPVSQIYVKDAGGANPMPSQFILQK
jgi:hypothetical protein